MGKPRKIEASVLPAIRDRWSTRAFCSDRIPSEMLHRIFEAARWSPSAFNLQPWRFIIGEHGDTAHNNILSSLAESNRIWASKAGLLVLAISDSMNDKDQSINFHHAYDCGQSVAQLTIQAIHEGLCVHSMGGFDREECRKLFSIPDRYITQTVIAIGFPGDSSGLPQRMQEEELRESLRIDRRNILFKDKFGTKTDTFKPLG